MAIADVVDDGIEKHSPVHLHRTRLDLHLADVARREPVREWEPRLHAAGGPLTPLTPRTSTKHAKCTTQSSPLSRGPDGRVRPPTACLRPARAGVTSGANPRDYGLRTVAVILLSGAA